MEVRCDFLLSNVPSQTRRPRGELRNTHIQLLWDARTVSSPGSCFIRIVLSLRRSATLVTSCVFAKRIPRLDTTKVEGSILDTIIKDASREARQNCTKQLPELCAEAGCTLRKSSRRFEDTSGSSSELRQRPRQLVEGFANGEQLVDTCG